MPTLSCRQAGFEIFVSARRGPCMTKRRLRLPVRQDARPWRGGNTGRSRPVSSIRPVSSFAATESRSDDGPHRLRFGLGRAALKSGRNGGGHKRRAARAALRKWSGAGRAGPGKALGSSRRPPSFHSRLRSRSSPLQRRSWNGSSRCSRARTRLDPTYAGRQPSRRCRTPGCL